MKRLSLALLLVMGVGVSQPTKLFGQEARPAGPAHVTIVAAGHETFRGKAADADFPRRVDVKAGGHTTTLVALGSGLRKKAIFKVYEGIAYAEENASLNADPYGALLSGGFATRVVMHFLRNVGANKIQNAWQDGFDKYIDEDAMDSTLQADKDAFLGYFADTDIEKGQTIELTWLPNMGLFVNVAGDAKKPINNLELASAVFGNWFGDKPISKDLKRDMVRFLSE